MMTLINDEEIIHYHLEQHPSQCFAINYNRYAAQVYQQCLLMTKDSDQAQDFTHDIFLKIFGKLGQFRQTSRFSTWLYSITYNYCLDQLSLSRCQPTSELIEELVCYLADDIHALFEEENRQVIDQVLANLSTQNRTLLRLKYMESRSLDEIAGLCNLTRNAVKMRLKRSWEKFRGLYAHQMRL